jgi:hypothetical protein
MSVLERKRPQGPLVVARGTARSAKFDPQQPLPLLQTDRMDRSVRIRYQSVMLEGVMHQRFSDQTEQVHMDPTGISCNAKPGRARYALRAWLIAVLPSLLYFLARVYIDADSLRPPALDAAFAGYSILAAPLLETALMFPLASLLELMIPQQGRVRIVLLAAICALEHKIGDGWQQVFPSIWRGRCRRPSDGNA